MPINGLSPMLGSKKCSNNSEEHFNVFYKKRKVTICLIQQFYYETLVRPELSITHCYPNLKIVQYF